MHPVSSKDKASSKHIEELHQTGGKQNTIQYLYTYYIKDRVNYSS